jgi:hypothetical protein
MGPHIGDRREMIQLVSVQPCLSDSRFDRFKRDFDSVACVLIRHELEPGFGWARQIFRQRQFFQLLQRHIVSFQATQSHVNVPENGFPSLSTAWHTKTPKRVRV